jgi:hypothetical protein
MRLKCLPLESWMKHARVRNHTIKHGDAYFPINPIIHRDGYYRLGNCCWFEVDSLAWACASHHQFQYSLRMLNAQELRPEQQIALKAISVTNLATKHQRDLWLDHRDCVELRATQRRVQQLTKSIGV